MYDVHVDSTLSVKVAANLDEHKEVAGNRFKVVSKFKVVTLS